MYFLKRKEYISRMSFVQYITAILLSLEPAYSDKEGWEERTARMETIAQAIDDASSKATCSDRYETSDCKKTWTKDKKSLGLLLVTKGFWESRFAKNVHEGKCRSYECDAFRATDGRVRHLARSPWQIQRTSLVTKEEYLKMKSSTLESTTMSANVATRYLVNGMKSCNTIKGAISIYSGAKTCDWSGATRRNSFYEDLNKKTGPQLIAEAESQRSKLETRLKAEKKKKEDKDKAIVK